MIQTFKDCLNKKENSYNQQLIKENLNFLVNNTAIIKSILSQEMFKEQMEFQVGQLEFIRITFLR